MLMNYRELSSMARTMSQRELCRNITESLQASRRGEIGHLKPYDFSIRQLAEAVIPDGREWVNSLNPAHGVAVLEASGAVDSTAFSNITGQLIINAIMEDYESPAFVFSNAFRTMQTSLSGEKIIGTAKLGDQGENVHEGMPFPSVGFGEDYIETPATVKDGLIVPVTKEAVFFDLTGQMLERASGVGETLGVRKEKRCVNVFAGVVNNHKWKGTSYNTYQAATPWINLLAGAAYDLSDWTDVDAAEQLFADITDPNTGEPVNIHAISLWGCPAKNHTINRIINATQVRYTDSTSETILAPNSLSQQGYTGGTSKYLYSRLVASGVSAANAKATWFLGDVMKAFRYMQNWPITVIQAPQNSDAEFVQDIVARYRAVSNGASRQFTIHVTSSR